VSPEIEQAVRMTDPVLVVDDEPMVRKCLARAIQRSGAEVVTAADGEEAFAKFRELRSPVVFTDLRMPRMDGLALMRSVKRLAADTSVVLVTGFWSKAIVDQAMEEGASRVITKPVTFSEVDGILAEVLRRRPEAPREEAPVLAENSRMGTILSLARRVARTDATVLIKGETGTGKELLARFVHRASVRSEGPFVAVNCSALPESLVESELFGHERGAFTGAIGRRAGRFEAASGGTLLLDEVTEIPLSMQAKLLRALQEREIDRIGGNRPVRVDVRVIALTNRDLRTEVHKGRFRQDLFYRLNVVSLQLPALRERADDIPLLSHYFLHKYAAAHGSRASGFAPAALERLLAHAWPGNVRELENVIQRAVILCTDVNIGIDDIVVEDNPVEAPLTTGRTVAEVERDLILSTLERMNGNRTHTAKALGVSVRTVRNRLREYRLTS
jgi:DNA-binding NtrC family response regulator